MRLRTRMPRALADKHEGLDERANRSPNLTPADKHEGLDERANRSPNLTPADKHEGLDERANRSPNLTPADKHEGLDEREKELIAKQFRRVRIAHAVLSDPEERNRLDDEGFLVRKPGVEPAVKPFHEYYSINTPDGYTRGGDFVSTRRYDPMVGAVDSLGRVTAGEKLSRRQVLALQQEEVIRLKGPEDRLKLGFHDSANAPDQYNQYWDKVKERNPEGIKEESAPNWKPSAQPKLVAQTRYMPLEEDHRDQVQSHQLHQAGIKGGHREE